MGYKGAIIFAVFLSIHHFMLLFSAPLTFQINYRNERCFKLLQKTLHTSDTLDLRGVGGSNITFCALQREHACASPGSDFLDVRN